MMKMKEVKVLLNEIKSLKNELASVKELLANALGNEVEPIEKSENLDKKVSNILLGYQITPNLMGYRYLKDAIELVYKNGSMPSMTKEVYPSIAESQNTTPSKVERAIRHAISRSYSNGNLPFGERPTNSSFIALVSERLQLEDDELIA